MPYIIVTFKGDGTIANPNGLAATLAQPFNFSDVLVFSHGWWTTAAQAESEYARFSDGVIACLGNRRSSLKNPPQLAQILALGIHWPSMVSESPGAFDNIFEAFSYDDMKNLAERVARYGVCPLLQRVWRFAAQDHRLRIHVLGHSMGCRVVCLALCTALLSDNKLTNVADPASAPWVKIGPNVQLNVVLFQAAIDDDTLERVEPYGILSAIANLRALVTRSSLDGILRSYPADSGTHPAMGATGPTDATFSDSLSQFYNQRRDVNVARGSDFRLVAGMPERFVVADLTQLHQANGNGPNGEWGGLSGHHSDIYCPEVYEIVTGFLF